ncbi:MAG: ATP-binding cassette domain-containing protein [Epsilonproteobacteria bacterium]|nr:ATP-binding cassette domain-containing protein [Campylobacterota bacterium]
MTVSIGQINQNSLLESYRMILNFHYGNVALSTIENLSAGDLKTFDIHDIKSISHELNLEYSYQKCDPQNIEKHLLPCIARNIEAQSIVIIAFENDLVRIQKNSESKPELITRKEFNEHFATFIFFSKKDKEINTLGIGEKKDKSWFYNPIKNAWRAYLEIGLLTIFINIFGLAVPLFTMNVYNRVVPNFATETLFVLSFGVAIVLIFDVILKSTRVHILEKVAKKLSNDFEEELFKKTLSIQSQYDRFLVGTKTNLFRELSLVKDFFATKVIHLLDLPFFVTAVIVIYLISPTIALVPIIAAGVILGLNFIMQYPIATLHKESYKEAQSKHGYLVEQLQGIEAIKLSNALPKRILTWRKMINFYNQIHSKIQMMNALSSFVSQGFLQMVSLATIILGVYCIHNGTLSVGGLIAVTILASRAMVPVINLSSVLIKYKQVKEALDSLNEYWHLPTESQKYNELGMGKAEGKIEFDNVTFSYPETNYPSIQEVSMTIEPGERVGIIGQTGAGKSTIQKLLTGVEMPVSGKIFVDDKDTTTLHPVELRENIALMPQEPYLFSGTLKENIELNRTISKKEMTDLLNKTGLSDLVKKSGSSDTLDVGERGANLSVGQRHLVALARALMSKAPILVLDEPTTGLDVGLEKRLVQHLDDTLKEKTVIVITHRFAALDLVDRVILIHDGKVVADGKKAEVLAMLQNKKG